MAEIADGQPGDREFDSIGAGCAVFAGIAAADAICCVRLGRHTQGQDHREALALLREAAGTDRKQLVDALRQLLDVKGQAHYGLVDVSPQVRRRVLRRASQLVEAASDLLA